MTDDRGRSAPRRPADGVSIVHRDVDLLVLFKPSGLATTSPDGSGCLASVARELDRAAPRLHASSRLDAEVTGLVTFARSERAIATLLEARRQGRYQRFYLALAARAPEPAEAEWSWSIAKDPRNGRRRLARPPGSARAVAALSRYRVLAAQPQAALLLLMPQTGRTHQLRVHASQAGAPLLGDKHYGGPASVVRDDGRVLRAPRVMLHCARLVLPGIRAATPLTLDAEVPDDMRTLYSGLGGDPALFNPDRWATSA